MRRTMSIDIENPVNWVQTGEKDGSAWHCNESCSKLWNIKKSKKAAMNIVAIPRYICQFVINPHFIYFSLTFLQFLEMIPIDFIAF